jgi:hypothetical protein
MRIPVCANANSGEKQELSKTFPENSQKFHESNGIYSSNYLFLAYWHQTNVFMCMKHFASRSYAVAFNSAGRGLCLKKNSCTYKGVHMLAYGSPTYSNYFHNSVYRDLKNIFLVSTVVIVRCIFMVLICINTVIEF